MPENKKLKCECQPPGAHCFGMFVDDKGFCTHNQNCIYKGSQAKKQPIERHVKKIEKKREISQGKHPAKAKRTQKEKGLNKAKPTISRGTKMKSTKEEAIDMVNRIVADMGLHGRVSGKHKRSFLYHRIPKSWPRTKYVFGYTPWKTKHNGQTGFFALKYRMNKAGDQLKLIKAVRFSKRKVARNRSQHWHKQYYGSVSYLKENEMQHSAKPKPTQKTQPLNRSMPSQNPTKKGGKKQMAPKIGKIQKAFNLHEKGWKVSKIAKKLELSERTVRAYIWRIGNPEKYKALLQRYFTNRKQKAQDSAKGKTKSK